MKTKQLLTVAAVAAGVFLLFRKGGLNAATLPGGATIYASNGTGYAVQPRGSLWDTVLTGGTVNLANSAQVIRPASPFDLAGL